jgi:hypothetical protein
MGAPEEVMTEPTYEEKLAAVREAFAKADPPVTNEHTVNLYVMAHDALRALYKDLQPAPPTEAAHPGFVGVLFDGKSAELKADIEKHNEEALVLAERCQAEWAAEAETTTKAAAKAK